MLSQDAEAFETLIQDLCLAFNRPYTTQLSRVFWESLKHLRIDEVKRAADVARKSLKKFPTPKDLIPERRMAPAAPKQQDAPMSRWAVAANKILFRLAYEDERRGFLPLGPELLARCLAVKADYVRMAEDAESGGEPWADDDFIAICREGFENLVTPRIAA